MNFNNKNISNSDVSIITKFKNKAHDFMIAVNSLYNPKNVPKSLQVEYQSLKSTADDIKNSIAWITNTVDSVTSFFSNTFSLNGTEIVEEYINNYDNSMGFISLIPIAAIIASMALMTKFISDVYIFDKKLNEQKRLEHQGLTPYNASKIVNKMNDSTIKSLSTLIKPIMITVSIFYLSRIIKNFVR